MTIKQAKNELFFDLKPNPEFVGCGLGEIGKTEVIVVYWSKANANTALKMYGKYRLKHKVIGKVKALKSIK